MTKKRKKGFTRPAPSSPRPLRQWPGWQQEGLFLVGILAFLVIFLSPMAIDGLSPTGPDVLAGIGKMHQVREFEKKTGERALWNPALFSGMPLYHRLQPKEPALDQFLQLLSHSPGRNGFLYFVVGSFGLYLLVRFWQVPRWAAALSAIAFSAMPNYQVIFQAGHFQQFRTLMLVPWVVLGFSILLKKGTWGSALFFALTLSSQIRARHYQIVFYTLLLLAFMGAAYKIHCLRSKAWKPFFRRVGLFLASVAFALVIGVASLLPMREYAPYSIRGGSGEAGSKGLDYTYATAWSFAPKELLSLLIPNAYGGASRVTYTGNAVPALKGQPIPGYWGEMPFTEGGEYVGILPVILATLGIGYAFRKKEGTWIALAFFIPFAVLLSFGKHFPVLYDLFFRFVPFFDKFRAPVMILTLVYFVTTLLMALGLAALFEEKKRPALRWVWVLGGILVCLAMVPFFFKGFFAFARPGEATRYGEQGMAMLRAARYDLMKADALRLLVLSVTGCGLIALYLKEKLPKIVVGLGLGLLVMADLIPVHHRFFKGLVSLEEKEASYFAETATDRFLKKDPGPYRIFPLEQDVFQTNDWSYHHASVGGYDPAKLRVYQDWIESCFFAWKGEIPVNWHLVDMLDVRYIISPVELDRPGLRPVHTDPRTGLKTYRNERNLERAWFVGAVEVIPDLRGRLDRLNDPTFRPDSSAILETPLQTPLQQPTNARVRVTRYEPNRIHFDLETDTPSLLVVSEIYYPKGWTALLDGRPTEILKANHALRAVVVPQGRHELRLMFSPRSYRISAWISGVANTSVLMGLIAWCVVRVFRKKEESA